jgi:hypothetical protein
VARGWRRRHNSGVGRPGRIFFFCLVPSPPIRAR